MNYMVKGRRLHRDTEEECKDDKEMIVSTDACAEDKIDCKEVCHHHYPIFYSKYQKPRGTDFQGIKSLIKEIFPDAHLDLDSLIRLIISDCFSIIVKQISSDEEDAEEINYPIDVHVVSAVVTITQNVNCTLQLRDHLMILANEYAPASTKAEIMCIFEDNAVNLLLIINEKDIDIPSETVIAPLECLFVTTQRKRCEECKLNPTYCIYICKIFKTTKKHKKEFNENNILKKEQILWINLEEKVMAKLATYSFEFSVDSELVNGLPNKSSWIDGPDYWNPDDYDTAVPYRRVLIFEFYKWQTIINKMRRKFNNYERISI